MKGNRFDTKLIHEGYKTSEYHGSLTPPLFHTSTYTFPTAQHGEQSFSGEIDDFIYSRLGNPTVQILEERMAALEEGEAALAFGSGMAAVSATMFSLISSGDHIICSKGIYGCTYGYLEMLENKFGIQHNFCEMDTEEKLSELIQDNTKVIFIETPINPTMKVIDIEMIVEVAKKNNITLVVDNTFCSPYLQKPLTLGCDIVLHSATKYISGHGDVVAGIVVCKTKELAERMLPIRKDIGAIMSPFDAWLLLRGLKTLAVRMDRQCENAEKVVAYLQSNPIVKEVFYPGDSKNKDHYIASKQMKKGGGVIAFTIHGTKQETQEFINQLKMVKIAVSLGDTETLIQHPATMTHAVVPKELQQKMGITDNLLRMSIGLEAWEDIVADLRQAFTKSSGNKVY
ncbi:methionine gamma-lyase [Bacillus sp. AFS017336]|uniref:methionine gamma-lyase n=1 Tax=Bacillus sp. AFS017336 TaxID=2033489 RepID=UPI000BF0A2A0|nr:methionine gamma-lyase [Bacillus sp. AFS017336]PEL11399.1 methionine gamma-lyase [Bacillus sp. AFS017336]